MPKVNHMIPKENFANYLHILSPKGLAEGASGSVVAVELSYRSGHPYMTFPDGRKFVVMSNCVNEVNVDAISEGEESGGSESRDSESPTSKEALEVKAIKDKNDAILAKIAKEKAAGQKT